MKVTDYEKTYVSVTNAVHDTKHLDAVVEFLRKQSEPVTCATIISTTATTWANPVRA